MRTTQKHSTGNEMKKYMILIAVGKDRPGIVDDVSTYLFERTANIEDSRMALMGGRFTIMTLFSCDAAPLGVIKEDIGELKDLGLEASLHAAEEPAATAEEVALPLKIDVTAMDHPGIVQKIVHVFSRHNVNIHTLSTQVLSAPLSGAPLFNLSLEAAVPAETSIAELKEALQSQAAEMNIDLNFRT
ncbi:MAG: ACT domain-containing protein [Desulfobacterales bacterium]